MEGRSSVGSILMASLRLCLPSGPQPLVNRFLPQGVRLLTALSRSRHFGLAESAVGPEIGSPSAARRSQFQRQRAGPIGRYTETLLTTRPLDTKPRDVDRGVRVNREPISSSRGRSVAPHSVGWANCVLCFENRDSTRSQVLTTLECMGCPTCTEPP